METKDEVVGPWRFPLVLPLDVVLPTLSQIISHMFPDNDFSDITTPLRQFVRCSLPKTIKISEIGMLRRDGKGNKNTKWSGFLG